MTRLAIGAAAATPLLAGCGGDSGVAGGREAGTVGEHGYSFPEPPEAPAGPLDAALTDQLSGLLDSAAAGRFDAEALAAVAGSGDPRRSPP